MITFMNHYNPDEPDFPFLYVKVPAMPTSKRIRKKQKVRIRQIKRFKQLIPNAVSGKYVAYPVHMDPLLTPLLSDAKKLPSSMSLKEIQDQVPGYVVVDPQNKYNQDVLIVPSVAIKDGIANINAVIKARKREFKRQKRISDDRANNVVRFNEIVASAESVADLEATDVAMILTSPEVASLEDAYRQIRNLKQRLRSTTRAQKRKGQSQGARDQTADC